MLKQQNIWLELDLRKYLVFLLCRPSNMVLLMVHLKVWFPTTSFIPFITICNNFLYQLSQVSTFESFSKMSILETLVCMVLNCDCSYTMNLCIVKEWNSIEIAFAMLLRRPQNLLYWGCNCNCVCWPQFKTMFLYISYDFF